MSELSKEQIKERLLKRTAEIWGVDEFGLEASFDPIISLFYDTLSHELVRISDSIKSSRTRITERLVDLLTPEVSTLAKPAHAIMHCVPVESKEVVSEFSQFIYKKREEVVDIQSRKIVKDYFFSPTGNFSVSNCNIKYIIGQKKGTSFDQLRMNSFIDNEKDYIKSPEFNTFWLGVETHKELDTLHNVMLYFNSTGGVKKELFLNNLENSKWEMGGNRLKIKKGYNIDKNQIISYKNYINESIQIKLPFYYNEINSFHEKYFINIDDKQAIVDLKRKYPEEFRDFINAESLEKFNEELVWIKVSMSPIIDQQVINNLHCYTNCFPVLNKKLIHVNQRSQRAINIIPLNIGNDYFLDIQQIDTTEGNEYLSQDREKLTSNKDLKSYLRYGGISRFDERDASELLHYLLDVLKEDSVAYKAIGDDFINNNILQLRQIIARIEQKVENKQFVKSKSPYLIIDYDKSKSAIFDSFFVSYWVTNGEKANKIHPFVSLRQYKGSFFQNNSVQFVTGTMGGENEPKASDKIYAYRENVLSKGRIVTNQDIINHCFNHYKTAITDVDIKKGVQVQQNSAVGYSPTVDIHLTKNKEVEFNDEDWSYLKESLKNTLEIKSANVLPFRIIYN